MKWSSSIMKSINKYLKFVLFLILFFLVSATDKYPNWRCRRSRIQINWTGWKLRPGTLRATSPRCICQFFKVFEWLFVFKSSLDNTLYTKILKAIFSYVRVNEWKFGEKRDNCTVYTFLHDTFHLQLVYEKSDGKSFPSTDTIQK